MTTHAKKKPAERSETETLLGFRPGTRKLEDVLAHYDQEILEIERDMGPRTPALLVGSGRPRKGQEPGEIQVKALRMPVPFWTQFALKAKAQKLSVHAAMRVALVEWSSRH
jgi:hypothetical protein